MCTLRALDWARFSLVTLGVAASPRQMASRRAMVAMRQPVVGSASRCVVCNSKRSKDGSSWNDDDNACKTCSGFSTAAAIPLAELIAIKKGKAKQAAAELDANMSEYVAHKVKCQPAEFETCELYEETRFKSELRESHDFCSRQIFKDKFGDGQFFLDQAKLKEVKVFRSGVEDCPRQ